MKIGRDGRKLKLKRKKQREGGMEGTHNSVRECINNLGSVKLITSTNNTNDQCVICIVQK